MSVGRLGVITQVKLRMAANAPVQRTLTKVSFAEFSAQVLAVQAAYVAAATPAAKAAALEPLRQTQVCHSDSAGFWLRSCMRLMPRRRRWRRCVQWTFALRFRHEGRTFIEGVIREMGFLRPQRLCI